MGAMGLYFGFTNIILISVIAFLLGAVIGMLLVICRSKNASQYMAFGPFIVISALITIFVPFNILFDILITVFTLGLNKR